MDRFILHEIYGMSAEDRKRFDLGQYADDGSILEDTVTGETYMDGWEPEDATFIRDLGWVPALLNTLAAETATQHAEVERLTAERAAFLAPVEGVGLDEVLRLDREGTPAARWTVDTGEWREGDRYVRQVVVNQYEEVTKEYDFADFPARSAELEAALAPIKTDEALITFYRTAAPALAREVIQLRAAVRLADEEGAKAIDRVADRIVADKWAATAAFQARAVKAEAEVARLRAEIERLSGAAHPSTPPASPE